MISEYILEMAHGRSGGAVFYLIISLLLFVVFSNLLIWVLQTHNRENKMFVQRLIQTSIVSIMFVYFIIEGIKTGDLTTALYKDSYEMEIYHKQGIVEDSYGYAHNKYIMIDNERYISKEDIDIEVGREYKIEYYKNSKLIKVIIENK